MLMLRKAFGGLRVFVVTDPTTEFMGRILEVLLIEFRFASVPARIGGVGSCFPADLSNVQATGRQQR